MRICNLEINRKTIALQSADPPAAMPARCLTVSTETITDFATLRQMRTSAKERAGM